MAFKEINDLDSNGLNDAGQSKLNPHLDQAESGKIEELLGKEKPDEANGPEKPEVKSVKPEDLPPSLLDEAKTGTTSDKPKPESEDEVASRSLESENFYKSNEDINTPDKNLSNERANFSIREENCSFDKDRLKEETGWSDDVIKNVENVAQAEVYKNAGLHEESVNGRKCLVKDIDYDYVDEKTGFTNRELMSKGRSPYDAKTGEKIELHHMGQKHDAPFAELNENSEHGDGNHAALHPKTEGSWRNDEALEAQYKKEKKEHWKTRSEE